MYNNEIKTSILIKTILIFNISKLIRITTINFTTFKYFQTYYIMLPNSGIMRNQNSKPKILVS